MKRAFCNKKKSDWLKTLWIWKWKHHDFPNIAVRELTEHFWGAVHRLFLQVAIHIFGWWPSYTFPRNSHCIPRPKHRMKSIDIFWKSEKVIFSKVTVTCSEAFLDFMQLKLYCHFAFHKRFPDIRKNVQSATKDNFIGMDDLRRILFPKTIFYELLFERLKDAMKSFGGFFLLWILSKKSECETRSPQLPCIFCFEPHQKKQEAWPLLDAFHVPRTSFRK